MLKELPNTCIHSITANDNDPAVLQILRENLSHNFQEDELCSHKILVRGEDITQLLKMSEPRSFDVIDLDPYGTPAELIPESLRALSDGGILCITATDMMVLCGASMSTSVVNYDALSMSGANCHEGALRLLLGYVARCAAKQKQGIRPMLSLSVDHYVRLFVQTYYSPIEASLVSSNIGHVFRCTDCLTIRTQPVLQHVHNEKKGSDKVTSHMHHLSMISHACDHCGGAMKMYGPMWLGNLHQQELLDSLQKTMDTINTFQHENPLFKRLKGLINLLACELNIPFSHPVYRYASILKTTTPSMVSFISELYRFAVGILYCLHLQDSFSSALLRKGFKVSRSHSEERGIKVIKRTTFVDGL